MFDFLKRLTLPTRKRVYRGPRGTAPKWCCGRHMKALGSRWFHCYGCDVTRHLDTGEIGAVFFDAKGRPKLWDGARKDGAR